MKRKVVVYRGRIGEYGWHEKPWFLPGERLAQVLAELERRGLDRQVDFLDAPAATDDELCLFHDRAHVENVRARCAAEAGTFDHGATPARAHLERAAAHVAGAALDGVRRILAGEAHAVFVPVAGFHHAHRAEARLYCLYNDPALAIAALLQRLDGPIAYVDVDLHQGDGVYQGFAAEPRVVIADLHESWRTLFPYTPEKPFEGDVRGEAADVGEGAARGTKLNLVLAPGCGDAAYLEAWRQAEAFLDRSAPAFIVYTAGMDALASDSMGHLGLAPATLRQVSRSVCALADRRASGRLLVLGGGGYAEGAASGWADVVETLL